MSRWHTAFLGEKYVLWSPTFYMTTPTPTSRAVPELKPGVLKRYYWGILLLCFWLSGFFLYFVLDLGKSYMEAASNSARLWKVEQVEWLFLWLFLRSLNHNSSQRPILQRGDAVVLALRPQCSKPPHLTDGCHWKYLPKGGIASKFRTAQAVLLMRCTQELKRKDTSPAGVPSYMYSLSKMYYASNRELVQVATFVFDFFVDQIATNKAFISVNLT